MSSAEWMDMMGKTLATIGAAWLCVLLALVLFDYVQNAVNGLANVLFCRVDFDRHRVSVPAGVRVGRDRN